MADSGKIIGIDLGTTNSVVSVMEGGQPTVIANEEGGRTTPSVVAFAEDGERLVGEAAKRQIVHNAKNTIVGAKRFMGRHYDDPDTLRAAESMSCDYLKGPNGDVWVWAGDRRWAIQEISAIILEEIKHAAVRHLAEEVTQAVIAVPAYFNDRQRHATRQAAKIAGLEVLRIINEPTAAALAYGLHQGGQRRVAVYDLGGGTFDVSILQVGGGAIEVPSGNLIGLNRRIQRLHLLTELEFVYCLGLFCEGDYSDRDEDGQDRDCGKDLHQGETPRCGGAIGLGFHEFCFVYD